MNKNLEKEYKMLMKNDAPDLWARIENGLEPKTEAAVQNIKETVVDVENAEDSQSKKGRPLLRDSQYLEDCQHREDSYCLNNSERANNGRCRKKRRGVNYRLWGTAAAACICVAVAIPAWLLSNNKNADSSGMVEESVEMQADASVELNNTATVDNSTAMDCAAADTAEEAVWEAEVAADAAPAEGLEESLRKESTRNEAAADMAEKDIAAAEDAVNNSIAEQEALAVDLQSQSISKYEMTVTICGIEESQQQVIYTARVEQAVDETLVGTQIEIYGSMESEERLEKDAEYRLELTAIAQEDGKIIFYQKAP